MRAGEAAARPSPLHVTNGDSAANTLRQTALGGAVLPWQDVLHEGPVPARRPRRLGQQAAALVVAQRLDVDAGPPCRLRSPHIRTLNPYLGTEINQSQRGEQALARPFDATHRLP